MSKELSAKEQVKLIDEAKVQFPRSPSSRNGYLVAAISYTTLLIEAQERVKDLENSMRNIIRAIGAADYWGAKRIANEAISPVNPQKKEDENNIHKC